MDKFAVINGFQLENEDKLRRVVYGTVNRAGVQDGGLGEDADPALVLATYDKLAGYITKDGTKIKTGSFYDFKLRAPRATPEVMYIFNVGGDRVEVADPKHLSEAVQTIEKAKASKKRKVSKFKED